MTLNNYRTYANRILELVESIERTESQKEKNSFEQELDKLVPVIRDKNKCECCGKALDFYTIAKKMWKFKYKDSTTHYFCSESCLNDYKAKFYRAYTKTK